MLSEKRTRKLSREDERRRKTFGNNRDSRSRSSRRRASSGKQNRSSSTSVLAELTNQLLLDGWRTDQEEIDKLKRRDNKLKQLYAEEKEKKSKVEALLEISAQQAEAALLKQEGLLEEIQRLKQEKHQQEQQLQQAQRRAAQAVTVEKTTHREAEALRRRYLDTRQQLEAERKMKEMQRKRAAVFDCENDSWVLKCKDEFEKEDSTATTTTAAAVVAYVNSHEKKKMPSGDDPSEASSSSESDEKMVDGNK